MTTTTDTSAMTLAQKSDRILAQTRGLSGATPNATRLIEELRLALESNRNDVQRLTAERDEARREVCFLLSRNVTQGCDGDTPEFHATARGWCYLLEEDDE
jgi:hypothetical protein